jgi:hypothetical protein
MNDRDHRDHLEAVCVELIDAELDVVSGGGIVITKLTNSASPGLLRETSPTDPC